MDKSKLKIYFQTKTDFLDNFLPKGSLCRGDVWQSPKIQSACPKYCSMPQAQNWIFFPWKLHHRKTSVIRTTKVKGQQQVTRGSIKQGVKTSLFLNDLCFRIMNDRFRLLTTLTIYPVSKHPDSCKSVKEFAHSCPHNKQIFLVSTSLLVFNFKNEMKSLDTLKKKHVI